MTAVQVTDDEQRRAYLRDLRKRAGSVVRIGSPFDNNRHDARPSESAASVEDKRRYIELLGSKGFKSMADVYEAMQRLNERVRDANAKQY